jgi:hypothetical protein
MVIIGSNRKILRVSSRQKNKSQKLIFDRVKKYKITLKISAQSDHWCPSSEQLKLRAFKAHFANFWAVWPLKGQ